MWAGPGDTREMAGSPGTYHGGQLASLGPKGWLRPGAAGEGAATGKGQSYYRRQDVKTGSGWKETPLPLPSPHLGPPPPSGPTQTEASPDGSPGEAAARVRLQGHKEGTKKQRIDPARVGTSQGTQDHQPAYL